MSLRSELGVISAVICTVALLIFVVVVYFTRSHPPCCLERNYHSWKVEVGGEEEDIQTDKEVQEVAWDLGIVSC